MAKILALQFKYLGDVAVATPALRALKAHRPDAELHVLLPEEAVPLLAHVPWVDRVWGFPRRRGRANLRAAWPVVQELRAQRFDVSVDLAGNDRGALLSALAGARRRIGMHAPRSSWWRRACYHETVEPLDPMRHESVRMWSVVSALGVPFPADLRMQIAPNPALAERAKAYLDGVEVLCFLNTSQPKREWPIEHWAEFHAMASKDGVAIGYTGGHTPRERAVQDALRARLPQAKVLPPAEPLELLLAAQAQLKGFISVDTGPLHFGAALGVPCIGLYGPNASHCWGPIGPQHTWLQGSPCPCSGHAAECEVPRQSCVSAITPARLYAAFQDLLAGKGAGGPR